MRNSWGCHRRQRSFNIIMIDCKVWPGLVEVINYGGVMGDGCDRVLVVENRVSIREMLGKDEGRP